MILSRLTVVSREANKAQSSHPTKKNATTTASHLRDRTVLQFSKKYFKIRMVKSQTHERICPSYHRYKTFVLVLYTTRSSLCNYLSTKLMSPTHCNEFFKTLIFCFHFCFFIIATHLTAMFLPESLLDKNIDLSWAFGSMYLYSENR